MLKFKVARIQIYEDIFLYHYSSNSSISSVHPNSICRSLSSSSLSVKFDSTISTILGTISFSSLKCFSNDEALRLACPLHRPQTEKHGNQLFVHPLHRLYCNCRRLYPILLLVLVIIILLSVVIHFLIKSGPHRSGWKRQLHRFAELCLFN